MNLILFDGPERQALLPLTFTRPVSELRLGMHTISEQWRRATGITPSYLTEEYLQTKYPVVEEDLNHLVNGAVLPNSELLEAIRALKPGQQLVDEQGTIAYCATSEQLEEFADSDFDSVRFKLPVYRLQKPYDLFSHAGAALEHDFKSVPEEYFNHTPSRGSTYIGTQIAIHPSASVSGAILNSETGPIFIDEGAEVMEGVLIRGPFYLGKHSTLKMGAKIYGPTVVGPHCKVGGEVNNSVFLGFANKAHDGFLGNSVIGEWCNLGADTNNSNLKNNYEEVKLWDYECGRFQPTGLQFCGLIMGDHSKCGINTMFNTGTVVGVSANIFGSGFPRNFIPSFSWGGASGMTLYRLDKASEVAQRVFARRKMEFDEVERAIFSHIFEETASNRNY